MKYDPRTERVILCDDVFSEPRDADLRPFEEEDLDHLRVAILELQRLIAATALPGLETVYHQISLRLDRDRRRLN